MDKGMEVPEARVRAAALLRKMDAASAARRMAAEFHVCVYAVRGTIYCSYYETDKVERVYSLN